MEVSDIHAAVIVGGSSGMGKALATSVVQRGDHRSWSFEVP